MPIIRSADSPTFTLPGVQFDGLTAPSRGGTELSTWRLRIAPHVPQGEEHWLDHEEVFIVISGALDVTVNGASSVLYAGDALCVPAGGRIQAGNSGDNPAVVVVCIPACTHVTMASGQEIGTPLWAQ